MMMMMVKMRNTEHGAHFINLANAVIAVPTMNELWLVSNMLVVEAQQLLGRYYIRKMKNPDAHSVSSPAAVAMVDDRTDPIHRTRGIILFGSHVGPMREVRVYICQTHDYVASNWNSSYFLPTVPSPQRRPPQRIIEER